MTPRTSVRSSVEVLGDVVALAVGLDDAVQLEGQVGQRLADAVVEVTGDAGALLVGSDGAQPGEPAGVVDGEGRRLHEAVSSSWSRSLKWWVSWCSRAMRPSTVSRAGSGAYRPELISTATPGWSGINSVDQDRHAPVEGLDGRVGQVVGGVGGGGPRAVPAGHHPRVVGLVEQEDRGPVEVEQVAEAAHGGVERIVEVERCRQGLGDAVERVEEQVGVGEAAEPVEGQGVLAVHLAGDPSGVAGDHGHQHQLTRPLHGLSPGLGVGVAAGQVRDAHGQRRGQAHAQREAEPACEAGHHHRGDQGEHEG
jgi:hypothetical protein